MTKESDDNSSLSEWEEEEEYDSHTFNPDVEPTNINLGTCILSSDNFKATLCLKLLLKQGYMEKSEKMYLYDAIVILSHLSETNCSYHISPFIF